MSTMAAELENLLSGKLDSVVFRNSDREQVITEINHLIEVSFPGCWTEGEFVNKDSDYIVYDLTLLGMKDTQPKIRLVECEQKFKLIRMQN